MLNEFPINLRKLNEYEYYHIALLSNKKIISADFDLTLETVKHKVNANKGKFDFKIIGTVSDIDSCLLWINVYQNNSILLDDIQREDIFNLENPIFVNCTVAFQ